RNQAMTSRAGPTVRISFPPPASQFLTPTVRPERGSTPRFFIPSSGEPGANLVSGGESHEPLALPVGFKNYMTPQGHRRMQDELRQLLRVERPEGGGNRGLGR